MAPLLLNHSMTTWKHWTSVFPPCLSSNSENTPPPLPCNLGQSYSIWLSMVLCDNNIQHLLLSSRALLLSST